MPEVPLRNVIQETFDSVADGYDSPALFARAGLCDVRVELKNAGYYLTGEHQWWDIIWNAGYRRLVSQLAPAELARFLREHLAEVAALATGDGIWLDVGLFTVGSRL